MIVAMRDVQLLDGCFIKP